MKISTVIVETRRGPVKFMLGSLTIDEIDEYYTSINNAAKNGTGERGAWDGMAKVVSQSCIGAGAMHMTEQSIRSTVCGLDDLQTLYKEALVVSGLKVADPKPGEEAAATE